MARKYLELEKSGAPFEELEQLTLGSLRKAVQEGDTTNGSLMAGQIAGMIKEERTCADIISSTVSEACKLMNGVSAMSKIAFIYPGQGAQAVGMGADFYEKSP